MLITFQSFVLFYTLFPSNCLYTTHSQFLKTVPSTFVGWKEYPMTVMTVFGRKCNFDCFDLSYSFLRLYFFLVRQLNDQVSFGNTNFTVYNIIRWIRCLTRWVLVKTCSLLVTLRDNGTSRSTREVYVSSLDQQGFVNTSCIIKWAI